MTQTGDFPLPFCGSAFSTSRKRAEKSDGVANGRFVDKPSGKVLVKDARYQRLVGESLSRRPQFQGGKGLLREPDADALILPRVSQNLLYPPEFLSGERSK